MDAAYDAKEIHEESHAPGHVPIIDKNSRNKKAEHQREQKAQRNAGFIPPEWIRYRQRSAFDRIKDEFGGRNIRVRGYEKVI